MGYVAIKISKTAFSAQIVKIVRKYTDISISDMKKRINNQEFIMSCSHIDDKIIKQIINLYRELRKEDISCLLYENDRETTCQYLENLLQWNKEIEEEIERENERESKEDETPTNSNEKDTKKGFTPIVL